MSEVLALAKEIIESKAIAVGSKYALPLAEYVVRREEGVRPTIKRGLKNGYGYCTCKFLTGAPFIVNSFENYCPNCGAKLIWK